MASDKTPTKPASHPLHDLAIALFKEPVPPAKPGREDEGPLKFTERGAALFLAFIASTGGAQEVEKMTPARAVEAAVLWRRSHVQCWQAMRLGDTVRMAMFSKALGTPRAERALRAEVDAITAAPRSVASVLKSAAA